LTTRESAEEQRRRQYRFGDFVLDLGAGFLRRNGQEVPLRPKSLEVLTYLVVHHGALVPKNDLVEAVWPDTAVTDNSLSQCLFEIRRALDDDAQRVIRTVARRGYVFDAPVSIVFGGRRAQEHGGLETPRAVSLESHADRQAVTTAERQAARSNWRVIGGVALVTLAGVIVVVGLRTARSTTATAEPPVQLTNFNDSAVEPSLSHDGRVLAFIRNGNFGTIAAPRGQVYVKVLPDGAPLQLTHDSGTKGYPIFSPNDSRVVYTTLAPGLSWESAQIPVLGGTPQRFLPNASGVFWLDDRRLVYSTIMSGIHMGIASSTESRSEYREIYFPDRANGMAHRSAASPDRKSLLVVEMKAGTWLPCRLMPVDGSSVGRPVSPPDAQCTTAAWSPDGQWMYFSSNAGGAFHIWRQRYPDGMPEQITFGPTEQEGTAITPDGKFLITSMGLQQSSIWLADAAGERKLTDEGYVTQPTMSPTDSRMFYLVRTTLSRGQTSGELWSVDLNSGSRQRVLPGVMIANYSLSRDGRSVVFSSSGNEAGDGIWIADVERRTPPRRLVGGTELRAFFGAPGEIIYTGEDSHLYRMKEDGSGMEMVSTDPVAYLSTVSPDGRWAVIIRPQNPNGVGTTSLAFMSLRGETSFDVCNDDCSVGPRSFLIVPPFAWDTQGTRLFVNLVHFGQGTPRTVSLPYKSDVSPAALWPKGLRLEKDVMANPGARVINAQNTFPASGATAYLSWRGATQSNLYRVRIPD
jgi:DNA-binding winged helix-turn-helix (wHTH) protein/Tol biopolymer transport system component